MKETSDTMQDPGQSGRGSAGGAGVVVVVLVVVGLWVVRGGTLNAEAPINDLIIILIKVELVYQTTTRRDYLVQYFGNNIFLNM